MLSSCGAVCSSSSGVPDTCRSRLRGGRSYNSYYPTISPAASQRIRARTVFGYHRQNVQRLLRARGEASWNALKHRELSLHLIFLFDDIFHLTGRV